MNLESEFLGAVFSEEGVLLDVVWVSLQLLYNVLILKAHSSVLTTNSIHRATSTKDDKSNTTSTKLKQELQLNKA